MDETRTPLAQAQENHARRVVQENIAAVRNAYLSLLMNTPITAQHRGVVEAILDELWTRARKVG